MKFPVRKLLGLAAVLAMASTTNAQAAICSYAVVNNWGSGFQGSITITNNGTAAINGWTLGWQYTANKITSSWNTTLTGNNPYSATALDWNKTIQPGQSVSFGVQGNTNGGTAEKPVVTGAVCSTLLSSSSSVISSSSSTKTSSSVAPSSSSAKSSSSISVSSSVKSSALSSSTSSSVCNTSSQCNWYGTRYPSCVSTSSGWGYENGKSCIANSTCTSQPSPFGLVSACGASSSSAITSSSSVKSSLSSSSSLISTSSSKSSSSSSVSSVAGLYPNYNKSPKAADNNGVASTATQIAAKIKLGFNIGNTLEATGCPTASETCWGNPKITPEFVKFVKQSGFNAIRLPASWNLYANQTTAEIDINWLNRVKEVVQYAVDNDLYVILNAHWDGGWLENNVTPEKQVANNAKQKAFWEQIATQLRDFDEHLIFAGSNEPNVENATQMNVLLSYHQTFIDAVRSTGGKNSNRVLIVQGPSTDIEKTNSLWTQMPVDTVPNKLMAEVHFYSPYNFTLMTKDESWGKQFYYWGKGFHSTTDLERNPTWGEEEFVDQVFSLMKTQFVDKGIPVLLGEFGVGVRTNLTGDALKLHLDSRAYYYKYVTRQAIANGLLPFYWDIGGLLDRTNNVVLDQQALDALTQGASGQR